MTALAVSLAVAVLCVCALLVGSLFRQPRRYGRSPENKAPPTKNG